MCCLIDYFTILTEKRLHVKLQISEGKFFYDRTGVFYIYHTFLNIEKITYDSENILVLHNSIILTVDFVMFIVYITGYW